MRMITDDSDYESHGRHRAQSGQRPWSLLNLLKTDNDLEGEAGEFTP